MKLRTCIAQYLRLKRVLGFRFHAEAVILRAFGQATGPVELGRVTPERVRRYLDGPGPVTRFWERKWVTLRGFYRFALARGLVRRSPLPTVLPKRLPSFVPYIYSHDELRRLLASIPTEPLAGLSAPTLRTLVLLLYGAGLRISEALALTQEDVDLGSRLLTIHQSKFFKSRWVPVGCQLAKVLAQYRQQHIPRRRGLGHPFFQTVAGRPIHRAVAERAFRVLRQAAGIKRANTARYQPRLHDLRHTFAVHRLVAWYRQGAEVQRLLPKLCTYLGHVDLTATQRYLTLTPELSELASRRFERYARTGGDHD
jgi:site-specific recombinase XerD